MYTTVGRIEGEQIEEDIHERDTFQLFDISLEKKPSDLEYFHETYDKA